MEETVIGSEMGDDPEIAEAIEVFDQGDSTRAEMEGQDEHETNDALFARPLQSMAEQGGRPPWYSLRKAIGTSIVGCVLGGTYGLVLALLEPNVNEASIAFEFLPTSDSIAAGSLLTPDIPRTAIPLSFRRNSVFDNYLYENTHQTAMLSKQSFLSVVDSLGLVKRFDAAKTRSDAYALLLSMTESGFPDEDEPAVYSISIGHPDAELAEEIATAIVANYNDRQYKQSASYAKRVLESIHSELVYFSEKAAGIWRNTRDAYPTLHIEDTTPLSPTLLAVPHELADQAALVRNMRAAEAKGEIPTTVLRRAEKNLKDLGRERMMHLADTTRYEALKAERQSILQLEEQLGVWIETAQRFIDLPPMDALRIHDKTVQKRRDSTGWKLASGSLVAALKFGLMVFIGNLIFQRMMAKDRRR
jgi:hypothetical protein